MVKIKQKYILGAALAATTALLAGCGDVPVATGTILGKQNNTLYIDLDGDHVADQKLRLSSAFTPFYEYACAGHTIIYDMDNPRPTATSVPAVNRIHTVNGVDLFVAEREIARRRTQNEQAWTRKR